MKYSVNDHADHTLYELEYIGNHTLLGKTLCYRAGYMTQFLDMIHRALRDNLPPGSRYHFIFDHGEQQQSHKTLSHDDINTLLDYQGPLTEDYQRAVTVYIAPGVGRIFVGTHSVIKDKFGADTHYVDTLEEALDLIVHLEQGRFPEE